jgi:hypothetical protein
MKAYKTYTLEVSLKRPASEFGLMLRKVASSQVLSEK